MTDRQAHWKSGALDPGDIDDRMCAIRHVIESDAPEESGKNCGVDWIAGRYRQGVILGHERRSVFMELRVVLAVESAPPGKQPDGLAARACAGDPVTARTPRTSKRRRT